MTEQQFNDLIALQYEILNNAKEHGFHNEDYSDEHCIALIISELCEALVADRKGIHANFYAYVERARRTTKAFPRFIKDTFEDELADSIIRILDFCALRNIKLDYIDRGEMHCSVPEAVYEICESLFFRVPGEENTLQKNLSNALAEIVALCNGRNIPIRTYIQMKMDYNKTREYLHGKLY